MHTHAQPAHSHTQAHTRTNPRAHTQLPPTFCTTLSWPLALGLSRQWSFITCAREGNLQLQLQLQLLCGEAWEHRSHAMGDLSSLRGSPSLREHVRDRTRNKFLYEHMSSTFAKQFFVPHKFLFPYPPLHPPSPPSTRRLVHNNRGCCPQRPHWVQINHRAAAAGSPARAHTL